MSDLPRPSTEATSTCRLNASLNEDLRRGERSQVPPASGQLTTLPEPVYPRRPDLLEAPDEAFSPVNGRRHGSAPQIYHTMQGWMFPFFRSRLLPGEFHPIIAYLFNEWKCNLDCHYCWAFDNRVNGMTEEIARRSIDWLVEKQNSGWQMVNSVQRLAEMKKFISKELEQWGCRAGLNGIVIRTDGSLAPCFPMYSANHDWGTIEAPRMDTAQLQQMKRHCEGNCFSTLNHILAFCYNDTRVIRWLFRQALHGFQGVRGNME